MIKAHTLIGVPHNLIPSYYEPKQCHVTELGMKAEGVPTLPGRYGGFLGNTVEILETEVFLPIMRA